MDLDGDEQEELLDLELLDEDGEDQELDFPLVELHSLLHFDEQQLILELCLLLEQQVLKHDEDGELLDELFDLELFDWELEEVLLESLIDEQLKLLELLDRLLKLVHCILEELQ